MTIDYALQIARGETYIQTVDEVDYEREAKDVIFNAIRNGTLIPEHHATFYQCNAELFKKCKKTHCQEECTLTTFKEYAKTDEFGNPIIAVIDNLYNEKPQTESEVPE